MATLTPRNKNTIVSTVTYLLTEAGDYLLQENGFKIVLNYGGWANRNKNDVSLTTKDKN